jgi:putative transcriptional regulator
LKDKKPYGGCLLLAEPFMEDPNFKRTVIILAQHNEEDGSFGFVLTRQAPLALENVVDGFEGFEAPLFIGGPVAIDTLHYLHTVGDLLPGSVEVVSGLYWGGNFEILQELVHEGKVKPEQFKFFLGYSGWDAGQLEEEMEDDSWIVHPAKARYVFKTESINLWKKVLQEKGGDYAMMVNFPENPILN